MRQLPVKLSCLWASTVLFVRSKSCVAPENTKKMNYILLFLVFRYVCPTAIIGRWIEQHQLLFYQSLSAKFIWIQCWQVLQAGGGKKISGNKRERGYQQTVDWYFKGKFMEPHSCFCRQFFPFCQWASLSHLESSLALLSPSPEEPDRSFKSSPLW